MFSKMLDNQNCLCVVSASNGKWKSFIEKAENIPECKEDSPYKKIILNRSEFINKYKSIYGMIIPEGVEDVLYIVKDNAPFVKHVYISSKVKKLAVVFDECGIKKRSRIEFVISKNNPYLECDEYGSVYTKDFKKLIYLNQNNHNRKNVINENCEVVGAKSGIIVSSKLTFPKNLKIIENDALFTADEKFIVPEGTEVLGDSFILFKNKKKQPGKIIIPASVKEIGNSSEAIYVVDENNPYFSSENGALYTKGFKKILLSSELNEIETKKLMDMFFKRHSFSPDVYSYVYGKRDLMYIKKSFISKELGVDERYNYSLVDIKGRKFKIDINRQGITQIKENDTVINKNDYNSRYYFIFNDMDTNQVKSIISKFL